MIMDRIHEKSQAAIDRCRNGAQRDPRVSETVAIQAPAPSGTRRCSVTDNWLKNLELDSKLQKERVEVWSGYVNNFVLKCMEIFICFYFCMFVFL